MGQPRVLVNALSWSLGGGKTYVLNLMRELSRDSRGFEFTVLVGQGQLPPGIEGVQIARVRLPRVPGLGALSRVLYEETLLPFRARAYDLLYCVADLAPAFGTTPTVVAMRNLNIYDHRFYDNLRLRTLERLVRLGMPRVRRIVFPSRAAARLIGEKIRLPGERLAVVPHGISADSFGDASASESAPPPYLFLPAPLERHKNMEILFESIRHLRDSDLQVWIAGHDTTDPPHARHLRARVESLGVGDRVRFLGPVPYREILSYYRGARALVFPSLLETFGHPLLEAMVARTPIVASDIPAFREVAGETAVYFDPRDPKALASAVDSVFSDPQATRRRVDEAAERARYFSWERSVDGLCRVFEEVLAEA